MKKIILLLILVLTLTSLGYIANAQVAIGSRSEEVKAIQEILKTDPNIYPEGYVTGYYGNLTEKAVRKLQKKCGLPETGVLDSDTEKCIFPIEYAIKVISPNGGEVWDRSQIQTIRWEVKGPEAGIPEIIKPFWPKVSIDLFRRVQQVGMPCVSGESCPTGNSIFVKHIAIANLFDGAWTYQPGKISNDVPNGSDYVIRISAGRGITSIWTEEMKAVPGASISVRPPEIWPTTPPPRFITWDESDGTFTISGEIIKPIPNLGEVIAILEKMIAELQKAIALLRGVGQ